MRGLSISIPGGDMGEQTGMVFRPAAEQVVAPTDWSPRPDFQYGTVYQAAPGAHPNAYFPHWGRTPQSALGRPPSFEIDYDKVGRRSLAEARRKRGP